MGYHDSSGAGEPENLNLHPVYNYHENPHHTHYVYEIKTRQTNKNIYITYYCNECEKVYVVRESWEHLQERDPEGNYLEE